MARHLSCVCLRCLFEVRHGNCTGAQGGCVLYSFLSDVCNVVYLWASEITLQEGDANGLWSFPWGGGGITPGQACGQGLTPVRPVARESGVPLTLKKEFLVICEVVGSWYLVHFYGTVQGKRKNHTDIYIILLEYVHGKM